MSPNMRACVFVVEWNANAIGRRGTGCAYGVRMNGVEVRNGRDGLDMMTIGMPMDSHIHTSEAHHYYLECVSVRVCVFG